MDGFGNDVVLFQEVTEPTVLTVAIAAIAIDNFNVSCYNGSDGTAMASGSGECFHTALVGVPMRMVLPIPICQQEPMP